MFPTLTNPNPDPDINTNPTPDPNFWTETSVEKKFAHGHDFADEESIIIRTYLFIKSSLLLSIRTLVTECNHSEFSLQNASSQLDFALQDASDLSELALHNNVDQNSRYNMISIH